MISTSRKMCCLGFYALACGLTENQILDIATVGGIVRHQVVKELPPALRFLVEDSIGTDGAIHTSINGANMMFVNDSKEITDLIRELKLTKFFLEHDVHVEFVN